MIPELDYLIDLINRHQPVAVLTGAGLSTGSGIPAYRDSAGNWTGPSPVQAREFRQHRKVRQRYWMRSMLGWPGFRDALPNRAHQALATLEQRGIISTVITQNVDGLHQRAGSRNVVELHGSLAEVVCLQCAARVPRATIQALLEQMNPQFLHHEFTTGPDGDANPSTSSECESDFSEISCQSCAGVLKPNVVFFGENVPQKRVQHCMEAVAGSSMLLCIGSSLAVMSGYRFCLAATKTDKPVALINIGATRADDLATVKITQDCADTLESLCNHFS